MIEQRDARKKYCPLIKDNCEGSSCMAWRWATVEQMASAISERVRLDDGVGLNQKKIVDDWPNSDSPPVGYCGLAGTPHCAL